MTTKALVFCLSVTLSLLLALPATPVGEKAIGTPIVIHFHTLFSDGEKRPEEVKWGLQGDGVGGLIIADHQWGVSEIGSPSQEVYLPDWKPNRRSKLNSSYGYQNYTDVISSLSSPGFECVPGAELSCFWTDKCGRDQEGHLLVLDISDRIFRGNFTESEVASNPRTGHGRKLVTPQDQEKVLSAAFSRGIPTVAAHAANESYPFYFGEPPSASLVPRLLEFFNTGVNWQGHRAEFWGVEERKEFETYLRLLRSGFDVGVTAGSDFHWDWLNGLIDKAGHTDQWHRYTYVCGLSAWIHKYNDV